MKCVFPCTCSCSSFATSIFENIRYGKPNATKEEVYAAARKANAFDFIAAFPNGFATVLGEKGVTVSGVYFNFWYYLTDIAVSKVPNDNVRSSVVPLFSYRWTEATHCNR
jgi:hypothetical protein